MNSTYEKFAASSAEYLSRLAMENMSPKTMTNYQGVLSAFGEFLAETEQEDEFVGVVAWRKKLHDNGLAPTTIKQYLITLQIFFKAASHRSYPLPIRYEENPIDENLLPKIPARPYEMVLTDEQVTMLYNSTPPRYAVRELWPRNYAMMMLCLNEKIRNAELLDLKLSDVDMAHHVLTVRSGKGRKWREVDLTDLTEQALVAYLNSGIRPANISEDDYLFGTTASHERGNICAKSGAESWHRGTGQWLSGVIERTVFAITGTHDVRSHDLRHVGSRVCFNAGQSMEELQGQLGHSNFATTQIYCSRMGSRRSRESARSVLAARDAAAQELYRQNTGEQIVIPLFA